MEKKKEIVEVHGHRYERYVTREEIQGEILRIANWIDETFADAKEPPILMEVQTGGKYFFVDLHREIQIPVHADAIGITSYPEVEKRVTPRITSLQRSNIHGRDIILVEDIIDSGATTDFLKKTFKAWGANHVKIVALVVRIPTSGMVGFCDNACITYKGDEWLYGYGMDDGQLGRQLTDIYFKLPD